MSIIAKCDALRSGMLKGLDSYQYARIKFKVVRKFSLLSLLNEETEWNYISQDMTRMLLVTTSFK